MFDTLDTPSAKYNVMSVCIDTLIPINSVSFYIILSLLYLLS